MPNKGIRNAVYKRAGGKGQSSKFYNIYGKVVKPTDPTGFKGGQGWTAPKPQIGSMLSLGIMKQNRNAGGNNVCQPGPKPKKGECVPALTANNIMTVGTGATLLGPVYGYGGPVGSLSPTSLPGSAGTTPNTVVNIYWFPQAPINAKFEIIANYSAAVGSPSNPDTDFKTISFINCDNKSTLTFSTQNQQAAAFAAANPTYSGSGSIQGVWQWLSSNSFGVFQYDTINAFWTSAVGKNIKVVFDGLDLTETSASKLTLINNYCCDNNNDCNCRGPSGQCPCRKGGC